MVRVHLTDTLRDVIGVRGDSRAWTLRAALARVARASSGVVVILRQSESPRELLDAVRGISRTEARSEGSDGRGTRSCEHLGLARRFSTIWAYAGCECSRAAPAARHFSAFGLEIVDYIDENG